MERSLRRYIIYIGLIGVLVVLFCACGKQTEEAPPFSDVSGMQGEVMTGAESPAESLTQEPVLTDAPMLTDVPSDATNTPVLTDAPTDAAGTAGDSSEVSNNTSAPTPTCTPVPTNTPTPTPVITDPYDGRFWTGKYAKDTELLLTKRQIEEQNDKNFKAGGTKLAVLSERRMYTAGEVLGMIEEYSLPSKKYFDNKEFGTADKDSLLQERNLSALRENTARAIVPQYGILVMNADLRSFPTGKRLTSEVQGRFDYLQETRLLIGEAVLVLHRSSDGAWCFVQAENYCGWLRESAVAYCDFDELCAVTETLADVEHGQVAVVTKNGNYRIGDADVYLRMGTRLLCDDVVRYEEKESQLINNERTEEAVTIKLPRRDTNGRLFWEEAGIRAVDAEGERCIVKGYLLYTRANVMQLAVRLLDSPYAWGDAPSFGADVSKVGDNGMDCSSTVSAVLKCFGFVLPRNTGTQRKMDCAKQDLSGLGAGQRRNALDCLQGGELLYTSGHVMLYLGKVDGEYYVLHNTSTESRDDGGKDEFYRCVITSMSLGKTGQTILDRLIQLNTLFP